MDSIPPGADLSKIPLGVNPSGAPPNFVDPPNLISTIRGVGVSLGFVSLVLIISRLVIYTKTNRKLLLDDVCVIIAFILAVSYTGIDSSDEAVTKHAWDTPLSDINVAYVKKLFVTSLLYGPMLFLAKASILLLYHRTFHPKRWLRISVYISLVVLFASYSMTVPLGFIFCMPHGKGKHWDLMTLQNCNHLATAGFIQGCFNIAADIFIFVLPLPVIFELQLPMKKKIALAAIFATGFIALTASILTLYFRIKIVHGNDPTWAATQVNICIEVEIYAAIWVACMPSLAKVLKTKFTETKIYANVQSLVNSVKGSRGSMFKGSRNSRSSQQSTEKLTPSEQTLHNKEVGPAPSIHSTTEWSDDGSVSSYDHSIYKKVTVDQLSQRTAAP